MRLKSALVSVAVLGAILGVHADPASADDTPAPVMIEEWPLAKVSRIGQEIYRYDRAAWLATDVLLAAPDKSVLQDLRGWIVVPEGEALKVRFIAAGENGVFRPGFDVVVNEQGAGPMTTAPENAPLPPDQLAMFKARQTAANNVGRLVCSGRFNTVVMDDPDSDGWLVWLLTATDQANVVPIGGHYRFTISADGASVMRRDMLSNSCINGQMPPDGAQPAMLFFTQIVSKGPVETHVFQSILNRVPIYIGAADKVFAVEGAHIEDVTSQVKP